MTTQGKGTALITGASSGIGAVYADRLARRGYDLIIVARSRGKLDALATRITNETKRSVEVLRADLNDKSDLARVEETLKKDASITFLLNNAGIGTFAPLLNSDVNKMDEMLSLNIGALTRLTYAAVPGFVARGTGTIVNISSSVCHLAGNAQRCLRRQQGLRACFHSVAAARTRLQGYSRSGRSSRRHRDGLLGYRWPACPEFAVCDCHDN